jgi:general secretion pathway protein B
MQRQSLAPSIITQAAYLGDQQIRPFRWSSGFVIMSGFGLAMGLGAAVFWGLSPYRSHLIQPELVTASIPAVKTARNADHHSVDQAVEAVMGYPVVSELPTLTAKPVDLLVLKRVLLHEQSLEQTVATVPQHSVNPVTDKPVVQSASIAPYTPLSQPQPQSAPEQALSLADRFAQAVAETQALDWRNNGDFSHVPLLAQLDGELTAGLPPITFASHVYSSDPMRRYVMLNEQLLKEGEYWLGMELVAIRKNDIVLRVKGHLARLEALADWDNPKMAKTPN